MNSDSQQNQFEKNLSRMLNTSRETEDFAFQEELTRAVLMRVKTQRLTVRSRFFFRTMTFSAAAAVVVIASIWFTRPAPVQSLGLVKNIYGIVTVGDGETSEKVTATADILPGQWIETLSGSKAEILLNDQSKLLPAPRSIFQIINGKEGLQVLLQRGYVAIQAAKQPVGKSLTVKTNGSRIRILGTTLDIRLVKKPDGSKQTRVSVNSGSVELESAGQKVLLAANTEGIADEGQTPQKRPLHLEVSEMVRLFNMNNELAAQSNISAGLPVIFDYKGGSETAVWTIVASEKKDRDCTLKLKYPAVGAKVYTLEGKQLPVSHQGRILEIDCSDDESNPALPDYLIVYLPDIQGIFRVDADHYIRFDRPAATDPIITLFQFRLPEAANIEQITPEPVEVTKKLNKLVVTVATDSLMFEVCE